MEIDLTNFPVKYAPIKDFGDFEWYDFGTPDHFDFVVCDGPPQRTTLGARVGLLPVMESNLASGCLILYDDYEYPDPQGEGFTVPELWEEVHDITIVEIYDPALGDGKPFALLKLP